MEHKNNNIKKRKPQHLDCEKPQKIETLYKAGLKPILTAAVNEARTKTLTK